MIALLLALLVVWVIVAVLGFAVHGLLWLAIIAIALFVLTGLFGLHRRR